MRQYPNPRLTLSAPETHDKSIYPGGRSSISGDLIDHSGSEPFNYNPYMVLHFFILCFFVTLYSIVWA